MSNEGRKNLKIYLLAIFMGFISDFILTFILLIIFILLISTLFVYDFIDIGTRSLEDLEKNSIFILAQIFVGFLCSIAGGLITGLMSPSHKILNSFIASLLALIFSIPFFVIKELRETYLNINYLYISVIFSIPFYLLGGYFAKSISNQNSSKS